jgi:hypothetical protein
MKRFTLILVTLAVAGMLVPQALAKDTGSRDILRLSDARMDNDEWKVAVHVINDQELAALDIPIRYGHAGDPIELVRVDFSERVKDWDFTHAAIDNQDKTVILGLISELVNMRVDADMKAAAQTNTKIADLVFRVPDGYEASFETFTTERPGHELTFIYNEMESGQLRVGSYVPEFEVDVDFKGTASLPTEFALSQNYPNPFNPTTSFRLSLPEESDYSIQIFNVAGQLVRSWDGHEAAGTYTITWDGRNNQKSRVASGVYFYKAEANGRTETRKMLMLK